MQTNIATPTTPNNTIWLWNLFATAVGAGILYLPINAGINGIWPIVLIAVFTLPMVYLAHRNVSRVVLSASKDSTNINDIIYEHFSEKFCKLFAMSYFLANYPLILIYSVGLTNTISSIITSSLKITYIPKPLISLVILSIFFIITTTKPNVVRKVTECLALPLAASLFILSIYLIPKWNLDYFLIIPTGFDFFETLWLTIPVVIFTFNFLPAVSTFTFYYMANHPSPQAATQTVLLRTCWLLFFFMLFFVFSCVLSVPPEQMKIAKENNLNILVHMGNIFDDPILYVVSSLIAIIAMSGAFLGCFFGVKESIIGLIEQKLHKHKLSIQAYNRLALLLIFGPSYLFCILDTNILTFMSVLSGPIIACLLFLFPVYAMYKIPAMAKYRVGLQNKVNNYFIIAVGIISCSAILYSFKYLTFFLR